MLLAHGFLARIFEVFGRHHIVVDLVTTSEVSISVTVDDETNLEQALAELEGIGEVEVKRGLAVVAVVGERAPRRIGLAGRVFDLLGRERVVIEIMRGCPNLCRASAGYGAGKPAGRLLPAAH